MNSSFAQIFDEQILGPTESLPKLVVPEWFQEDAYLEAHPDVAAAVERGDLRSGYDHYQDKGWREKRSLYPIGKEPRGRLLRTSLAAKGVLVATELRASIEAMLVSPTGGVLVVGWIDDTACQLDSIKIYNEDWSYTFDNAAVVRFRRPDVETAFGASGSHAFGFLAFAYLNTSIGTPGTCDVTAVTANGGISVTSLSPRRMDDVELRNVVLSYVAESEFFGNRQIEVMRVLDGPFGGEIINHNLQITRGVVAGACVQRFGVPTRPVRGSIIVCLYGKPEYLFLQNALFSGCPGFDDYELIYVSNSPEMAERLLKEADAAHRVYGLPLTIVLLPGNAGFGAANNVAAQYARSDRILIVNPDVFPRDRNWAEKHSAALANLPLEQTRLFGAPLYYDDGTLMHGGMYFEFDTGVSLDMAHVSERRMLRVEHYGKGAPVWAPHFLESRPIQAVTGAFISVERNWYEMLGGFTESYVFGHYEDADLCLKSIQHGVAPWIHDIRLWHLEGKGSLRLPVHEGGSLVNRWFFTKSWSEIVRAGFEGPSPTSPMMWKLQSRSLAAATSLPEVGAQVPVETSEAAPGGSSGHGIKHSSRKGIA